MEDIIQFVNRGDLRNPASGDDYYVYLYDRYQAEALAAYLTEHGLGTVELVAVEEAGLLDISRPGRGRPPSEPEDSRSPDERLKQKRANDAARQKRKRDRDKEEKICAGDVSATRCSQKGAPGAADKLRFANYAVAIAG